MNRATATVLLDLQDDLASFATIIANTWMQMSHSDIAAGKGCNVKISLFPSPLSYHTLPYHTLPYNTLPFRMGGRGGSYGTLG